MELEKAHCQHSITGTRYWVLADSYAIELGHNKIDPAVTYRLTHLAIRRCQSLLKSIVARQFGKRVDEWHRQEVVELR